MNDLYSFTAEQLLAMEPEELAGVVLMQFNKTPDDQVYHSGNFAGHARNFPNADQKALGRAFMEAWSWLTREGLLAKDPGQPGDWFFVTRRGRRLKTATDCEAFRKASLMPKELLHPALLQKAYPPFLRGEYDTAVFVAFREVEEAVRTKGGFTPDDIGTKLMRTAFTPGSGTLCDASLPSSEQEAEAHLFAGAIGRFKNPSSHRTVGLSDAAFAVELILIANHLLRIVESRPYRLGARP